MAVIGGFIWLATLPGPRPVDPAPTPVIPDASVPLETPLVADAPSSEVEPTRAAPPAADRPDAGA